jgi:hypothetical protein
MLVMRRICTASLGIIRTFKGTQFCRLEQHVAGESWS